MHKSISLLSWNIRGLSQDDKCDDVLSELISAAPTIASLQETKLSYLSTVKARCWRSLTLISNRQLSYKKTAKINTKLRIRTYN
jgi:exonuclease III